MHAKPSLPASPFLSSFDVKALRRLWFTALSGASSEGAGDLHKPHS